MLSNSESVKEIAQKIGRKVRQWAVSASHGLNCLSYITGMRTVRTDRLAGRRLAHVLAPVGRLLYKGVDFLLLRHIRAVVGETKRFALGFPLAGRRLKAAFRRHPLLTIPELLLLPFRALWRHRKALGTLFNLAAPVAAAFVLAATVNHWTNLTFALSVEYDGEQVGYITDESVFDNAAVMAEERVINTDNSFEVQRIPKLTIAVVNESQIMDEAAVCDQILRSSSSSIEEASGLYVDGTFEGAVDSRQELDALLQSILAQYTDGSADENADTGTGTNAGADGSTHSNTNTDYHPGTGTGSNANTNGETDSNANCGTDGEADSKTDSNTDGEADRETDSNANSETDSNSNCCTNRDSDGHTDCHTGTCKITNSQGW